LPEEGALSTTALAPEEGQRRTEAGSALLDKEDSMITSTRRLDVRIASAGLGSPEMVGTAVLMCGVTVGLLLLYLNELAVQEQQWWIVWVVVAFACVCGSWFLLAYCNHLRRRGPRTWLDRVVGVGMLGLAGCFGAGVGFGSLYRAATADRLVSAPPGWRVVRSYQVSEDEAQQLCRDLPDALPSVTLFRVYLGFDPRREIVLFRYDFDSFGRFLDSTEKEIRLDLDGATYVVTFWLPDISKPALFPQSPPALTYCARQLSTTTFTGQPVRICLRSRSGPPLLIVESTDP
jgi:hypothetical protein